MEPHTFDKDKRGFASMDKEKQRKIASAGGKSAHAQGRAHKFIPEEARGAGRLGGLKRRKPSADNT